MKLLWLSHLVPYPPSGGVRQRSFGLLSELSKRFDVTFAGFNQASAFSGEDELQEALEGLSNHCRVSFVESIPSDLKRRGKEWLAAKSLVTPRPYTINWLESSRFPERLRAVVDTLRPDFVHFDTVSLAPYLSAVPGVARSLNHHNIESHMLFRRAENETNGLKGAYFKQEAKRLQRYEAGVASGFGVHLVCSEPDARRLESLAPHSRIEVVPNGVDVDFFRQTSPPPERIPKTLIFAGGLTWYPNLSAVRFLVREIWPLIPDEDARLTIIGRSPPDWLQACAQEDPRISVLGWVDDVRPHMERAATYVCPIFDGGGTKLKVLDALAMGVPLVANPIACEGIEVQDGREVLLATDPPDFVKCIRRLWDGNATAETLGRNGVKLIHEKYSFAKIGKELADLYREIASN